MVGNSYPSDRFRAIGNCLDPGKNLGIVDEPFLAGDQYRGSHDDVFFKQPNSCNGRGELGVCHYQYFSDWSFTLFPVKARSTRYPLDDFIILALNRTLREEFTPAACFFMYPFFNVHPGKPGQPAGY